MLAPGPYVEHVFGNEVTALLQRQGNWVTASVHHSVDWPPSDMMLRYDGREFFLRGVRDGNRLIGACICLMRQDEKFESAVAAIYRFASILGWYKRGFVEITGQIGGNHAIRYERSPQPFLVVQTALEKGFNCNYLPVIGDDLVRRALAFWREGKWLEHQHAPYAFLSFYKVIESQFQDGRDRGRWIEATLPTLIGDSRRRLNELTEQGATNHSNHIFESGRCAVAHAGSGGIVADPDRPQDRIRLSRDLVIIRDLAERYIRDVLGVPDELDVERSRDRLTPIYDLLPPKELASLIAGEIMARRASAFNGLELSVATWPDSSPEQLSRLAIRVAGVRDGRVYLEAKNASQTISLPFVLDFPNKKAHVARGERYATKAEGGNLTDSLAVIELRKAVLMNQRIELHFAGGRIVDCEIVIPMNVDSGLTLRNWDLEAEGLRREYEAVKGG